MLAATAVATFLNAGPSAPPPVVVQMRDGTKFEVPAVRPAAASQRFIVEFRERPRTSRATVDRFRGDLARLRREKIGSEAVAIGHEYVRAFHGVSVTLGTASVDAVRRLAYVKRVAEDAPVHSFATDEGHLTRIGADRMWSERNVRGDGIVVAVIDTGIDYGIPPSAAASARDSKSSPVMTSSPATTIRWTSTGTARTWPASSPAAMTKCGVWRRTRSCLRTAS